MRTVIMLSCCFRTMDRVVSCVVCSRQNLIDGHAVRSAVIGCECEFI